MHGEQVLVVKKTNHRHLWNDNFLKDGRMKSYVSQKLLSNFEA